MGEHSIIPPSSAGRIVHCSESVLMAMTYPEQESTQSSLEGDVSHEIAANMINALARGRLDYPNKEILLDSIADNGVLITEEMYDGAEVYAQDVEREMKARGIFSPMVEFRIEAKRLHELSYGTFDCAIYDKQTAELILWDYKFGHKYVSEYENWQGINYVAGLLDFLKVNGLAEQYLTVKIRIAQPRVYGKGGVIREWKINAAELRPYFNKLEAAFNKALSGDYEQITGPHCYQCPGLHACESAKQAGFGLFEVSQKVLPLNPSNDVLGLQYQYVLRAIEQLGFLSTALEEQIKSKIRSGEAVPGFDVQQSFGRKKWNKPAEEIIKFGKLMGVDLSKISTVTPNEAKKRGLDPSLIDSFSETPSNGYKVVKRDDSKAKLVFTQ